VGCLRVRMIDATLADGVETAADLLG